MVTELRIWWRAQPYIKKLKEIEKMKFTSNLQLALHVLTILAGLGVSVSDLLPDKHRIYVLAATGAIQAFLAKMGSLYNPDGTPAELPWKK